MIIDHILEFVLYVDVYSHWLAVVTVITGWAQLDVSATCFLLLQLILQQHFCCNVPLHFQIFMSVRYCIILRCISSML